MTDRVTIVRLSPDALQSFLDRYVRIVEEELRTSIGLPPWFDSALSFLVAEIVRDFARHKVPMKCSAQWIRAKARRAGRRLERTLARYHATNGVIEFSRAETFEDIVGSVLQRKRSLYWEELRRVKPLSSHSRALGGAQ